MWKGYRIAPGYVLVKLDDPIKKMGMFNLPEEEKVNQGTVLIVGGHSLWWKRLFRVRLFVSPMDRVVIGQVRQEIDRQHVICHIDHLLVKV